MQYLRKANSQILLQRNVQFEGMNNSTYISKLVLNYTNITRYDYSDGSNLEGLANSMLTTGFQATNVALAIKEINRMVQQYFMNYGLFLRNLY